MVMVVLARDAVPSIYGCRIRASLSPSPLAASLQIPAAVRVRNQGPVHAADDLLVMDAAGEQSEQFSLGPLCFSLPQRVSGAKGSS